MENKLFEQVKDEAITYGKALGKVGKLHFIGIVSRVLGLFLLILTVVLCVFALFTFGAVAAIDVLAKYMPVWAAALLIGSTYLVLMIVAVLARKPLFVHPFISLLTKQVIGTQEQLTIETLKAEQEVTLQTVRIETKVDNATRELNFYTYLVKYIWNWLSGKLRRRENT